MNVSLDLFANLVQVQGDPVLYLVQDLVHCELVDGIYLLCSFLEERSIREEVLNRQDCYDVLLLLLAEPLKALLIG